MGKYLCLSSCLLFACLSPLNAKQPSQSSDQRPAAPDSFFVAKEKEVWEALRHKDKAAATRLLADDFVGMYDFGFFNKSEWIKQIDDQYTVDDYAIMNPKVLHPSPSTALLLYTSTCKGTGAWADYCSNTSRIADLWVKRDGRWVALFSQDTTATGTGQESRVSGETAGVLQQQLLANEKKIWDTSIGNDFDGWSQLVSDDALAVYDTGYANKSEVLTAIRGMDGGHYSMEDVRIIPVGDSAGRPSGYEFKSATY